MQYTFSNKDKVHSKSLGWVSKTNTSNDPNQGIHIKNAGNNSVLPTAGSMPMKSGSADNDASFAMGRRDFVKTVSSSPMTMNNTDQSSYLARRKALATGKIIQSAPISFSSKDRNYLNSSLRKARNKGYVVPKNVTYSRMRKAQDYGFGEIQEPWTNAELTSFTLLDGFTAQLQIKGDLTYSSYSGAGAITGGVDNIASVIIGTKVTDLIYDSSNYQGAFQDLQNLVSVTIPSSVTTLGQWVFYNDNKLTTVTFEDTLEDPCKITSISGSVFEGCTSLSQITLPSSITSIGLSAFSGSGLTSITIPSSVISIGNTAFFNCTSLTGVTFKEGSSLSSIESGAFNASGLTSITIPASVTSIGNAAFYNCTSLTGVIFEAGSSLSSIGTGVFRKCTALESITIPANVTSIAGEAFYDCTALESITIPANVTSIAEDAFSNCTSLTKVIFDAGSSLSSIGSGVFAHCTALKDIVFNSSTIPSTMSSSTFPTISQGVTITAYYTQSSLSQRYIDTLKSIFGDENVKFNQVIPLSNSLGATYQEGDSITFNTFGSGFDTELGIFDENGNHVTSNDDGGGGQNGESKIDYTFTSVGKYYLVVGGYDIEFSHHDFGIKIGHTTITGDGTLSYGRSGEQLSSIPFTITSANKYRVFSFDIEAAD